MTDPGVPASVRDTPRIVTRRQGLIGAALLGTAAVIGACSSSPTPDSPTGAAPSPSPADVVVADERALIALYDETIATLPSLRTALQPLRDQHVEHIAALTGAAPDPGPAASSAGPSAAGSSTADPKAAVQALIAAERAAMRQRIDACVVAPSPEVARTLAFIAASEGSHIPALKDVPV